MKNKDEFRQLYNKLYSENFNEIETLRNKEVKIIKKVLKIVAIIFICVIISAILIGTLEYFMSNIFYSDGELEEIIVAIATIVGGPLLLVLLIVISSILLAVIFKQDKKTESTFEEERIDDKTYQSIFKQKIIKPIIQLALPGSYYFFHKGLDEEDYHIANWEKYDIYHSEDIVVANININKKSLSLMIAEVRTQGIIEDSDGESYVTLFHGLAGYIELPKDIGCYIKIINNNINLFAKTKDNLQMDVSEFEKVFDVQTDNKIKTMQILTADIMEEFLDVIEKNNFKFEFYINNRVMHIRCHTGKLFEPKIFNESLQFEYLRKYFNLINSIKNIAEHICDAIMNIVV